MHSILNARKAGFALLVLSVVLSSPSGARAGGLFARGIAVEGGLVSVEAGVMGDPSRPPLPFGKSKQPVRYFVDLKNETAADLWADVELQRPEKKAKSDFGRVRAGMVGHWTWPAIGVVWNEPVPVRVKIYADEARSKQVAEKEMNMFFEETDKEEFSHLPKTRGGQTTVQVLSGWREMVLQSCKPVGTVANEELTRDLCKDLWKKESVDHAECEHPITAVKPLDPARSALLAKQPEDFRNRADAFRSKGDLILETWSVKSCDSVTDYEVMMIKAPQGGTDFMTAPVRAGG